jgi:hypothetical protein
LVDLLDRPGLEKFIAVLLSEKVKSISLLFEDIQSIANSVTSEYPLQQRLVKLFTGILIPGLDMEAAIQKWVDHIDIKYPRQILKVKTEKIISADIKIIVGRAQMTAYTTKDIAIEKTGIPGKGSLQQESEKSISKKDLALAQKDETLKAKKKSGSTEAKSKDKVIADVEKKVIAAIERIDTTPGDDELRQTLQEGVYIDNAGAVIIAPFLRSLFSRVGLLTGNDINDVDKALFLLHYCVTGNTRPAEFELLFLKYFVVSMLKMQ